MNLMQKIWREGTIPQEWKESIVVPLHKRGDEEKVTNYRGISLLCMAYKVYADILRSRLEKEVVAKELMPESQAGFRKGRTTMDNIFVLTHLVQRDSKRETEGRIIYMMFADLKAAFDKVDRSRL